MGGTVLSCMHAHLPSIIASVCDRSSKQRCACAQEGSSRGRPSVRRKLPGTLAQAAQRICTAVIVRLARSFGYAAGALTTLPAHARYVGCWSCKLARRRISCICLGFLHVGESRWGSRFRTNRQAAMRVRATVGLQMSQNDAGVISRPVSGPAPSASHVRWASLFEQ